MLAIGTVSIVAGVVGLVCIAAIIILKRREQ